eukprot:gnl/TRDRNA2_/TRDRNA2_162523_c2_seq1.p1 gnl/TRDRNA2_/TRDRNA2_162523_c2~~gnl/TRDRNA2_/TRDRNA2_162523_c2_seq1.p1  ORF type:complete len:382 (-),score=105.64 gnl/TRDRNA2_/TRDRNA2_162523_c2_seq1:109-1125(-)
MAYVAQHAFHHLEKHLTKTPTEYILWRFAGNDDQESLDFKNKEATEDEAVAQAVKWCIDPISLEMRKCSTTADKKGEQDRARAVKPQYIKDRRMIKGRDKEMMYEIKWYDKPEDQTDWVGRSIMIQMGYIKMVQREDEKQAIAKGLQSKPLSAPVVEKHLGSFAVDPEAASHTRISALSGGQKVKVVIAAAMWQNPHILIFDEPTNYLDRDGLGALIGAIKDFEGGVIIISHNREFCEAVASEKWIMDKGRLRREGDVVGEDTVLEGLGAQQEDVTDSLGNKIEVKAKLSDKERKKKIKDIEKKLALHAKKPCLSDEDMWKLTDELEELKRDLNDASR